MPGLQRIAGIGILVGLGVFGLKMLAFALTGSVALYSDALESTVNVVAAIIAFLAIRVAVKPADSQHPYGHHKAEYFSAVVEGVMIVIAALLILREAYLAILAPRAIDAPVLGLAINAVAGLVNACWCWKLFQEGRANSSPALIADAKHLFTDVLSTAGVILGLLLAVLTGWHILDPLLGAIVAVNIVVSGALLIRNSFSALMDESVPDAMLEQIKSVIARAGEGAIESHDIRTRAAGPATFIEFHLVVPGAMQVLDAHDLCDRIERALKGEIPGAVTTIHIEPEHKAKTVMAASKY